MRLAVPGMVVGRKLTLRAVCDGGGRFRVDAVEGTRKLVYGGGCLPGVIYGASLTAAAVDGNLDLSIGKASRWRLVISQGNLSPGRLPAGVPPLHE